MLRLFEVIFQPDLALLQQQILEKSILALRETALEDRDHTSMMLAVDKKNLDMAKAEIKNFRRKMAKLLGNGPQKNDVYTICISLFPLTQTGGTK